MPRRLWDRADKLTGRLWRRIGRRGIALLFFAFLDAVYAFSLWFPVSEARRSITVTFIASIAPLRLWALMWAISAVVCFVAAFMKRSDRWGFATVAAVKTLWGLLYVVGAFHGVPRAYVSATLWLVVAGWVGVISTWPEPPDRVSR